MSQPSHLQPLVQDLLKPRAYPEHPSQVALLETHVSYLFLTGSHVYKVKKPVNLGFLDFTTLRKRHHYCQQEVLLNRRLSPDIYLGVVRITLGSGGYTLSEKGKAVEYAVKMLQLPQGRALSRLLDTDQVTASMMEQLAQRIAHFHSRAEASPKITRLGAWPTVRHNVLENFLQTEQYIGTAIPRSTYLDLKGYSQAFLETCQGLFKRREQEQKVRDTHGDLHTAQIWLVNGVEITDCIEFNQRFRYGDVASDIAFLSMDLDYHGRPELSRALLECYVEETNDTTLWGVLDFYKIYRAYVRGKVSCFLSEAPNLSSTQRHEAISTAQRYFQLARSYLPRPANPQLFITSGLVGTGKSTVAQELSQAWGPVLLSSDVVRKTLAGISAQEHRWEPFGQGIYSRSFTERTYQEMFRQAASFLQEGRWVIIDASFIKEEERQKAQSLAEETGATLWIIQCVTSQEAARRRLEQRKKVGTSPSDGRWEIYEAQKKAMEPIKGMPQARHITIDTSEAREKAAEELFKELYRSLLSQELVTEKRS